MSKYSILEVILESKIDFSNKENMTKNIINQSISLSLEIEEYLKEFE